MAMQTTIEPIDYVPTVFDFSPMRLTDEQFESLCRNHPDLNLELSAEGEPVVVEPTTPYYGAKSAQISFEIGSWARKNGTGICFGALTLFTFPNGAKRSPDAAWVRREKWDALSEKEKKKFSSLVPDFVVELRSASDSLNTLQAKMSEYISNGVWLGWLIDPENKQVTIYRENGDVEVLGDPETVSGEDVLPGFELNVHELW